MPNRDHAKILSQGIHIWNRWRMENRQTRPGLAGIDMRNMVLRSADLAFADLRGADLRDTNLRHANLSNANLGGARLYRAFLSNAKLQATSFREALLYETVFANVVLSTAKHLETCVHRGPSVIDHRTLDRSEGIPLSFLRGCGLPDFAIAEATKPRQQKTRYHSCFISYASSDEDFAERLYSDLQRRGVRCWFAREDIPTGAKFRQAIDEGIREREKVLLILSQHAVRSRWVEKEVETAFEEEGMLIIYIIFQSGTNLVISIPV